MVMGEGGTFLSVICPTQPVATPNETHWVKKKEEKERREGVEEGGRRNVRVEEEQ